MYNKNSNNSNLVAYLRNKLHIVMHKKYIYAYIYEAINSNIIIDLMINKNFPIVIYLFHKIFHILNIVNRSLIQLFSFTIKIIFRNDVSTNIFNKSS